MKNNKNRNKCKQIVAFICASIMFAMVLPVNVAFAVSDSLSNKVEVNQLPMQTIYAQPAEKWQSESLPLGNGFIGASVFGGVNSEEILINEHTLWSGGPGANSNYDGGMSGTAEVHKEALKNAREQLQQLMDEFRESYNPSVGSTSNYPDSLNTLSNYILSNLLGEHQNFGSYQEFGRIHIDDPMRSSNGAYPVITTHGNKDTYQGENVEKIFDGDNSTKWYTLSGTSGTTQELPVWVQIETEESLKIASYGIVSGGDANWRDPKDWKLMGSHDGIDWENIDTQSNITFSARKEEKKFTLSKAAEFRYIRLQVDAVLDNRSSGGGLQMSECVFYDENGNKIDIFASEAETDYYQRVLDLDKSTATVEYLLDGVSYHREYFVSYPDNFMAGRLTSVNGKMNKQFRFTTPQTKAVISAANGVITITGCPADQVEEEHLKFASQIRFKTDGEITTLSDSVLIENATWIEFYMAAGTNYQQCMDDSYDYFKDEDPLDEVSTRLDTVMAKEYDDLKQAHIEDYQELFNRVKINLGTTKQPEKMTDELLQGYSTGKNTAEENRYLEALYYQFGRYLLISSSREGSLPANLQGIWGEGLDMNWKSDYHANINLQMNYWLAEQTNLSECHQPLIDYINSLVPRGHITANHYHYNVNDEDAEVRGWTTYHENNIWGNTAPSNYFHGCAWFPTAGAWLAQHIWEQYAFTLDKAALEENWETLLGAALFWVDNLVEDSDGTLVSAPSYSPEHGPFSMGVSSDQAIIWEVFNNTIKAAEVLGIDTPEIEEIRVAQSKLYLPEIGVHGQYMEWKEEITLDVTGDYGHRHVNHLYAIHPGTLVVAGRSEQDDAYIEAMKNTLNTRGDGGTGWSMAWKLNFWARLRDGDHAFKMLQNMLVRTDVQTVEMHSGGTYDNLFDAHPPFQIDGNFGAVSGMTELFVQSQGDAIELLPALPSVWYGSSISGIRARGNVELDIASDASGKLANAVLKTGSDNDALKIRAEGLGGYQVVNSKGEYVKTQRIDNDTLAFAVEAGETYTLKKGTPVKDVTLDKNNMTMEIGDSIQLIATIEPNDATVIGISWKSSDENVVKVENGVVTAVGFGDAVITVTSDDGGCFAKCNITVGQCLNDHTEVVDEAVSSTCTEPGLTVGKHCSDCGKILIKQISIPAKGHKWVDADCDDPKTCSSCGETEGEPIGHDYVDGECKVCGEVDPAVAPEIPDKSDHSECESGWLANIWNAIINFFRRLIGLPEKCVCGENI